MSLASFSGSQLVLIDEYLGHRHHYAAALAGAGVEVVRVSPDDVDSEMLAEADLVVIDAELRCAPDERARTLNKSSELLEKAPYLTSICMVVSGLTPDVRQRFERLGVQHIFRSEDVYHSSAIASKLLLAALMCNTPSFSGRATSPTRRALSEGSRDPRDL